MRREPAPDLTVGARIGASMWVFTAQRDINPSGTGMPRP